MSKSKMNNARMLKDNDLEIAMRKKRLDRQARGRRIARAKANRAKG